MATVHRVEPILLVDIEVTNEITLDKTKLNEILRDFNNVIYRSTEPICIDRRLGRPFKILDGKHRIHAARRKNQGLSLQLLLISFEHKLLLRLVV